VYASASKLSVWGELNIRRASDELKSIWGSLYRRRTGRYRKGPWRTIVLRKFILFNVNLINKFTTYIKLPTKGFIIN